MGILIKKLIKILKNIGIFFLTYMVIAVSLNLHGIAKDPIKSEEYHTKNSELIELKEELDTISYDSLYKKESKKVIEKESELEELKNRKVTLENEIDYLNSKLN